MAVVAFLAYVAVAMAIGVAAGRIARQAIDSSFAALITAMVAAAAVSAVVSKVLLAVFVALSIDAPTSVARRFVVSLDLPTSELLLLDADLVGSYFVSVLVVAPLAAAFSGEAGRKLIATQSPDRANGGARGLRLRWDDPASPPTGAAQRRALGGARRRRRVSPPPSSP